MTEWGRADRPRRQRRSAGRLPNRKYLPPRQHRDRRRRDARLPLDRCRWSSVRTEFRSSARVLRSTSAASDQSSSWPKRTASAPPLANASCLSWPWPVSAMRVRGSSSAPLGVIAIFAATWPAPEPENSTPDATRSAVSTGRCFVPLISADNAADPPTSVPVITANLDRSGTSARKWAAKPSPGSPNAPLPVIAPEAVTSDSRSTTIRSPKAACSDNAAWSPTIGASLGGSKAATVPSADKSNLVSVETARVRSALSCACRPAKAASRPCQFASVPSPSSDNFSGRWSLRPKRRSSIRPVGSVPCSRKLRIGSAPVRVSCNAIFPGRRRCDGYRSRRCE